MAQRKTITEALEYLSSLPSDQQDTVVALLEQMRPAHGIDSKLSTAIAARVESFVDRANQLEQHGYLDTALDLVYDSIDELLRRGQFALVDSVLDQVNPESCSIDVRVALLTATAPAAKELATRARFMSEVETTLKKRGEWETGLLDGLSG